MHREDCDCEGCALRAELDRRRNDPDYMARLERHVEENREVLDRLARE